MSKKGKKKSRSERATAMILLATAALQLIQVILEIIEHLLE